MDYLFFYICAILKTISNIFCHICFLVLYCRVKTGLNDNKIRVWAFLVCHLRDSNNQSLVSGNRHR
jgi:hypothetical protein